MCPDGALRLAADERLDFPAQDRGDALLRLSGDACAVLTQDNVGQAT
jgi:hypothetical protein